MKKLGFATLANFAGLNFILSLLLGSGYLFFAGTNPGGLAFAVVAHISNLLMIYALLSLLSLALYIARATPVFFNFLFGGMQVMLALDLIIYKIFRFHINSMVVNLIITPGGLATLGQGFASKILFALLVAVLFGIQFWFIRVAINAAAERKGFAGFSKRKWKLMAASCALVIVLDKGLIAWAILYDVLPVTSNAQLFPLYQPLKIRSFAKQYFGVKLDDEVSVKIRTEDSKLDYPKAPLTVTMPGKPLNILIVVIDSFRRDVFTQQITPNLWEFSKKAKVFTNHKSGGNCTRFGIFSIFYGLYGNYWFSMLGERRGPVFLDELKKQNYSLKLFASAELSFPEFNKTCFVAVPREGISDKPKASGQEGKDIEITNELKKFLRTRQKNKPYLGFVFFDASHGAYVYPQSFGKFKPAGEAVNYLTLDESSAVPLFNKYKNSIYFEDNLTGEILREVEQSGGLKDTVVLVTGDHGEAFFERGFHGHNRSFSPEEINVPLVFYAPGLSSGISRVESNHVDIVPALMSLIGVSNPASDYSNGEDMLKKKASQFETAFSWDTSAILKDGGALVIPLEVYKGGLKLYDKNYAEVKGRAAQAPFMPYLSDFQKKARRFYK